LRSFQFRNGFSADIVISSMQIRIEFGPVTKGLRISPTGSKRRSGDRICHHTSDRQYRSHAFNRAKMRQLRLGLSLPNRSLTTLAKLKAHDKFLAPVTPAKARLLLLSETKQVRFLHPAPGKKEAA
jgi:hypothetical protein